MAAGATDATATAERRPGGALGDALAVHADRLLPCVHCGFCLPACPTYTRLGDEADSPRGRLHLMRAVVEGRLDAGSSAFQTHIDRCLGCRACETVCPSGVEYGTLLEHARAEAAHARRPSLFTRTLLAVFASAALTAWVTGAGRVLRATGLPALLARMLPDAWPFRRLRLALAMLASSGAWRKQGMRRTDPKPSRAASRAAAANWTPGPPLRVALLEGCVQQGLFGAVNGASARVLEANGCGLTDAPGQGCCGALHAHAGDLDGARALARANIDAFEASGADVVAVNAAGCGAAMKAYGELLAHDPDYAERAAALAMHVKDLTEVLAERGPRPGAPVPVAATWDAPCHLLHGQRVSAAPAAVLAAIPGLALHPLENASECCGGAGAYGVTHPELAGRIGRDKAACARATGADVVVTANPGCQMQIGAWLRMTGGGPRTAHLVELLDESYRRAGLYR